MRATLLVPEPFDTVSGGYGYDRAIVAGLRARGHAVDVGELDGRHPLPDDTALASARAAWHALGADTVPVIDGLCLPSFAPFADTFEARHCVGLIHHPTALEPGHDDVRDRLHAIETALMPRLARVIVTSAATAERLARDFGVAGERITVVVPGTADAPRASGSGGPGCAVLAIGVLTPRKGHDVLLRALAGLPDLDWTLTIVGGPRDATHARALIALAEEKGITRRVTFAGELTGDALEAAWRRADVFALATHYEGYGMVIAEALKRGLPVAAGEGAAASGLITPEVGVVCPAGDHVMLSKSLRRLIFDTDLRGDMAEAAWQAGRLLPDWPAQARLFATALGS